MTERTARLPVGAEPAEGRTWDAVHGAGRVAIAGAERVVRQAAARRDSSAWSRYVTDPHGHLARRRRPRHSRRPSGVGRRAPAGRAAHGLGTALGGGRRAHRGRPGAAAGGPLLPLPPDGVGRRPPRGRARRQGAQRPRLPRPRLLGHRRLRAALPGRDAPARRPRPGRLPRAPPRRGTRGCGRARGFDGARFPWESADTGEDVTPRRLPDQHGRLVDVLTGAAGGAHHRRRRLGGGALPGVERRSRHDAGGRARSSPRRRATGPRASSSTPPAARTSTA